MRCQVTVSWGEHTQYTFDLEEVQPMPHELARSWLDEQFIALDLPFLVTERKERLAALQKALKSPDTPSMTAWPPAWYCRGAEPWKLA